MLIAAAPVAIPVTTANPPTEAVASEAAQKPPIPEVRATADNPHLKNSTESEQETKNGILPDRESQQDEQAGNSEQQEAEQQEGNNQQQIAERQEIEQLKSTDREVKAHEAAHANVGGQFAGVPQLTYTTGPDGKRYAVAGEVSIDTSKVANNPEATIKKMQQIRQAALAPANPSSQDFKVASLASQIANQALIELNIQKDEQQALQEKSTIQDEEESDSIENTENLQETNSVSAKQSALTLSQKIVDSGALTDTNVESAISLNA